MARVRYPEGWLGVPLAAAIAGGTSALLGNVLDREPGQVMGVSIGVAVGAALVQAGRLLFPARRGHNG